MRRTRLLCAIGVTWWSAVVACRQAPPTVVLSQELQAHVNAERFEIVTSIRGLPLGVREEMQVLFGTKTLDIAEPGAAFQNANDGLDPALPLRQLVSAGCSTDHCLVYYQRGGTAHSWHAALFHWTPARTTVEGGGIAPHDLGSVDEVRNAFLSGAIKAATGSW